MKNNLCWLMLLSLLSCWGYGQTPAPAPAATPSTATPSSDLKSVLSEMDQASKNFKSAEADVELVQYTKIVDDTSKQSGHVFFRKRGNNNMDVALLLVAPQAKQVVISGDSFSYYDSKTGQTANRKIGEDNRSDVETMMNLGFGGRGQELIKEFDVKLVGWETVDGINTAKLDLIPKGDHFKQYFTKITLWIDPKRDVPLKQQRFESSGDYQLTHYSNIQVPGKVSDDVFKLKKVR